MTDYSSLRAIVIRENWLGCTGLSAANALMRKDIAVQSVVESEFFPSWKSIPMKVVSKLVRRGEIREFNNALIGLGDVFRPHLVLVVKGALVRAESIRKLKRMGVRCICFYPDGSMLAHGPNIPETIPEYDWVFTTKSFGPSDMERLFGMTRCSYLPHAADPEVHKPRKPGSKEETLKYQCDLSFIGGWDPGKEAILSEIARAFPGRSMKIWGARWENVPRSSILTPFIQHREIFGPGYALGIGSSRINLGLLQGKMKGSSSGDLITSRTFHLPACGGFMLHERTPDLAEVFEDGVECASFAGAKEAIGQVEKYMNDEQSRAAIAEKGRERVLKQHLWDHRADAILDRYFLMQPEMRRSNGRG
jgi:spore maturation protein CgeB